MPAPELAVVRHPRAAQQGRHGITFGGCPARVRAFRRVDHHAAELVPDQGEVDPIHQTIEDKSVTTIARTTASQNGSG